MASPLIKRFQVSLEHNKLFGFAAACFVLGLAGVAALIPPKPPPAQEYQATAFLAYSSPPPTATETGRNLFEQGRTSISTKEALVTEQVVIQVMDTLDIKNVDRFFRRIDVKLPKKDDPPVIRVQYKDTKEERTEAALSLLLNAMVEQSRTVNTARLRAQIEAIQARLIEAKADLKVAEQEFYRFMSQEGTDLMAAQDGSLFGGITTSRQQQRELRFQLEGVTAQLESIAGQLGLNPAQAALASALSADPIIANLRAQILQVETELAMRQRELRPEHPMMVELFKQQSTFNQLLIERADELVGNDGVFTAIPSQVRRDSSLDMTRQQLANRLVDLQTQQDTLSKQLAIARQTEQQLRQQYESSPDKQLEQERLQQQLTLKKNFHDFLQAKLVDAQSAEAETVGNLTITQTPIIQPIESAYSPPPSPLIILAAGMVGSVLVGTGVIFVMGILDPRLHTATELRGVFRDRDLPLLGELPLLGPPRYRYDLPLVQGHNADALEQYELLRSTLRRLAGARGKVVAVTSLEADAGKSVTAYNLAIAAAHAGQRTLVLEADLRSPSHAPSLNITVDPDAASEPLSYYGAIHTCTALAPDIANLYVIPSAGPQAKAAMILEASELNRLLRDARSRYDLVIVDTPALEQCNDALLLQPLIDGLLFVTRPGLTQGKPLGRILEQLIEDEVPLLGGVVNGSETVTRAIPATPPLQDPRNLYPHPLPTTVPAPALASDVSPALKPR